MQSSGFPLTGITRQLLKGLTEELQIMLLIQWMWGLLPIKFNRQCQVHMYPIRQILWLILTCKCDIVSPNATLCTTQDSTGTLISSPLLKHTTSDGPQISGTLTSTT